MTILYLVPIESLEERYSAQWNKWWPEQLRRLGVQHESIYPKVRMSGAIQQGQFLDAIETNFFKAAQLQDIMRLFHEGKVKDNDVFLLEDLWFPGLEMLFYVRDALGIKFKIVGCLHAGTYDEWDFLAQKGMGRWAIGIEDSWFDEVDGIFVATKFHKELLCLHRSPERRKVHITGFPMYDQLGWILSEKQNIVVFPHRLAPEKDYESFCALENMVKDQLPNWRFVSTKKACRSKEEYYALLSIAKIAVSCAQQETWGIAQQEALFSGCVPIVPDRLSYVEMYGGQFRYTGLKEAASMLLHFAAHYKETVQGEAFEQTTIGCRQRNEKAIPSMVRIMREDLRCAM